MKILIAYATKYGTTEKCANLLKEKLGGNVTLTDISKTGKVDLSAFDCVIIGGPIYVGRLRADVKKFCFRYLDRLSTKKIGLFVCHLEKENEIIDIMSKQFPQELFDIAVAKNGFGGAAIVSKMKGLDKFMFTKIAKTTQDSQAINYEHIDEFVRAMQA